MEHKKNAIIENVLWDDIVGKVRLTYYDCGFDNAVKTGQIAADGRVCHVCYFNDEYLVVDESGYYSFNLTDEVFGWLLEKADYSKEDKDLTFTITEVWYDTESGVFVEDEKKVTTYSDTKIRQIIDPKPINRSEPYLRNVSIDDLPF